MTKEETIDYLNKIKPKFLNDMGCMITDADADKGICKMDFDIDERYCHSVDIVQGGFVTAMLDAVVSHAAFIGNKEVKALSTMELKVSFYEASRMGKFSTIGRVDKMGRSVAFLSGDLYNDIGLRTASITATAKLHLNKKKE